MANFPLTRSIPKLDALPEFHPSQLLRDWGGGKGFRIADALTGTLVLGATGSGKTSGVARHLALAMLVARFGFLIMCSKSEEVRIWRELARLAGREDDLVIVSVGSHWCFNFLDYEATRSGGGAGFAMNIVAILDELGSVLGGNAGAVSGGGDNQFFEDALHHMNMNVVDLPILAGLPITLKLLRSIVASAPRSQAEARDSAWQESSVCAALLRTAHDKASAAGGSLLADFEECSTYWLQEFPNLSEKTRSIIELMFSMLVRPFNTRPLRELFGEADTTITPEACFDGKIIIVDVPIQEYHLAGKLANLTWKYNFQRAVMRRMPPTQPGTYLRPVVLWADEAQNVVTRFDAIYQAVARSAGGCTVYLTQNRESFRLALGSDDAVDALLGNLQLKCFCQNGSPGTNGWASGLMGERWLEVSSRTGGATGNSLGNIDGRVTASSGFSTSHQRRNYVEPVEFATLRRGGEHNGFLVDCLVYNGGERYPSADGLEEVPYKFLTFNQRG